MDENLQGANRNLHQCIKNHPVSAINCHSPFNTKKSKGYHV